MAMEWLLRYCRAKSLTEKLVMMTLMPEMTIMNICMSAFCHGFSGKTRKGGGGRSENAAPSPNAAPPRASHPHS